MKAMSKMLADMQKLKAAKEEEIEISTEDMPDAEPQMTENKFYIDYSMQEWIPGTEHAKYVTKRLYIPHDPMTFAGLVLTCLTAVKKRNSAMTVDNYLRCWTQDMAEKMAEAGISFDQLITKVKSRLSSETSSLTTNASDITSSNLSRPTKMASQTSLL